MAKIRQTVDTSEADRKFTDEFQRELGSLCGLVEEMFGEHKETLLSQTFREVIREKGMKVKKMLFAMKGRLVCDNPGDDLKVRDG